MATTTENGKLLRHIDLNCITDTESIFRKYLMMAMMTIVGNCCTGRQTLFKEEWVLSLRLRKWIWRIFNFLLIPKMKWVHRSKGRIAHAWSDYCCRWTGNRLVETSLVWWNWLMILKSISVLLYVSKILTLLRNTHNLRFSTLWQWFVGTFHWRRRYWLTFICYTSLDMSLNWTRIGRRSC